MIKIKDSFNCYHNAILTSMPLCAVMSPYPTVVVVAVDQYIEVMY